jgi:hypothetical protein
MLDYMLNLIFILHLCCAAASATSILHLCCAAASATYCIFVLLAALLALLAYLVICENGYSLGEARNGEKAMSQ